MPDFDLESLLPLLMSRQKQQQAEQASGAAASLAGKTLAPNLYDYLTNKAPTPAPPIPNQAGKVPPQDPMDPRIVPALRDVGMLGAGGALGRVAAPLAGEAAGLVGQAASRLVPTEGMRVIGGAAMMQPTDQAQAARLSYEQRQQLELQRQQAEATRQAEEARTLSQAKSQAEADRIRADSQRQQEEQTRMAAALQAKKEREMPFREAHPTATAILPWAAAAGSVAGPAVTNALGRSALRNFTGAWENAGEAATKALLGRSKNAATLGTNKLREYEQSWPQMQQKYDSGTSLGSKLGWGFLPAEGTLVPTEWDAATQQPNSPSYPKPEDWANNLARGGVVWGGGTGMAGIGGKLKGAPVMPYTGGPGIIRSYEQRYPLTAAQQKQLANTLKQLPSPP